MVYDDKGAWLYIGIGAVSEIVVFLAVTIAFQNDAAAFISLLTYMTFIYAFLSDYFIFHVTITPIQIFLVLASFFVMLFVGIQKFRAFQKKQEEMKLAA